MATKEIDRSTLACPLCGESVTTRQLKRHQNGEPCRKKRWDFEMASLGFAYCVNSRMADLFSETGIEMRKRPPAQSGAILWAPEWAILWVDHFKKIEATDAASVALVVCGLRLMKGDPRLRAIVYSLMAAEDVPSEENPIMVGGRAIGRLAGDTPATRYMRELQCPECLGVGGLDLGTLRVAYIESCGTCENTGRRPENLVERRKGGRTKTNPR